MLKFQIGILEEDAEQQKLAENNLKSQVQSLEKLMESNKTMNETLSHSIMTEDNTHLMNEMCSLQNENVRSPGFCKSKFLFYYSFGILFPNSSLEIFFQRIVRDLSLHKNNLHFFLLLISYVIYTCKT